jgi:RNA polymerase sigma factor (sigma-70 family)
MWQRWTDENPTDEELLDHWARLIRHVAKVAARTYKLNREDAEDIVSEIQLRLLRMPQLKRPYEHYGRQVINNTTRTSIIRLMCRGGSPGALWRDYETLSYRQAAPSRDAHVEDAPDEADRAIPIPDSPEARLITRLTLDAAMEHLSDSEREAVCHYYLDGLSLKATGEQMGTGRETTRSILKSAVCKLGRVLG